MKSDTTSKSIPGKRKGMFFYLSRDRYLYLMFVPVLAIYFVFRYIPMYGILMAFQDYSPFRGITGSTWVGFKHFEAFFTGPFVYKLLRNTILINVYGLAFGFPAPIILALAFNEIVQPKLKKAVQSVAYLPYFISTVIITGMVLSFLSPSTGIVNTFIKALGFKPIYFMTQPNMFYAIFTGMGIWQGIGFSSIIYTAAITQIDVEQYEAAKLDGAGKWLQMRFITLPGILPAVVTLLILRMGSMLSVGFEAIINLYNPTLYETADVLSTYVYRLGLERSIYSQATAVGLFESVVGFMLVISTNALSKKVTGTYLW